jgi:uncharacterized protein involved in response to NO
MGTGTSNAGSRLPGGLFRVKAGQPERVGFRHRWPCATSPIAHETVCPSPLARRLPPFFLLACLAGLAFPLLWALMFTGKLPAPASPVSALQWHAHEMFFGFGWAVLGGFLLTATKNWVQVRGWHGPALVGLAAAWVIERVGMAFGAGWPPLLFWLSNLLFLAAIVAMLLWTLLRHRGQDSFADNPFFYVVLPAFLAAKLLVLDQPISMPA